MGHGPCQLWGVLNVTPDSFSDGGHFMCVERAVDHARAMVAAGADVVDVGGASSRPAGRAYGKGAPKVPPDEELRRTLPVVRQLVGEGVAVSIDTTSAEVAEAALGAGARYLNDVSCGADDVLLRVAAKFGADYVLMHTRGDGAVAGQHIVYADVVSDVLSELQDGVARAQACGVARERIWLDPGIGFAKTPAQSLRLLAATAELSGLGQPVLVGPSRKAFIAATAPRPDGSIPGPGDRQPGTDAALAAAVLGGATAIRVHDVEASFQSLRVAAGIHAARAGVSA
ncbi:MAG: dihydropteroate synthase [Myxococcales bacterium]|nr:dihydropteroate synthase [Myxococcales bacterium]